MMRPYKQLEDQQPKPLSRYESFKNLLTQKKKTTCCCCSCFFTKSSVKTSPPTSLVPEEQSMKL